MPDKTEITEVKKERAVLAGLAAASMAPEERSSEVSTTRSPSTPRTRARGSSTESLSSPAWNPKSCPKTAGYLPVNASARSRIPCSP